LFDSETPAWIGIKADATSVAFTHDSMLESFACIPTSTGYETKPFTLMDYGSFVIVKTYTKVNGTVLHKIDGTSSVFQYDQFPGPDQSFGGQMAEVGGGVAFTYWTSEYGTELWWTDGTSGNIQLLAV